MANTEGMKTKFCVLKIDDINQMPADHIDHFHGLLEVIAINRISAGKKPNRYLVINIDEPYADEVIEIMKRHGHWG